MKQYKDITELCEDTRNTFGKANFFAMREGPQCSEGNKKFSTCKNEPNPFPKFKAKNCICTCDSFIFPYLLLSFSWENDNPYSLPKKISCPFHKNQGFQLMIGIGLKSQNSGNVLQLIMQKKVPIKRFILIRYFKYL